MYKIRVKYKQWDSSLGEKREEIIDAKYYSATNGWLKFHNDLVLTPSRAISLDRIAEWEVIPDPPVDELKTELYKKVSAPGMLRLDTVTEEFLRSRGHLTPYYIGARYMYAGTAFVKALTLADQYRLHKEGPEKEANDEKDVDGPGILNAIKFLLDTDKNYPSEHPLWRLPRSK